MLASILSGAVVGIEMIPVEVEVDLGRGMMIFSTVGLPSSEVSEAKTRVKSALVNSELDFPQRRVIVNLAPAHIKKEGTAYDLPIALGILVANEQLPTDAFDQTLVVGELSLDGRLRGIRGALSLAVWARKNGIKQVLVPEENGSEIAMVSGVSIWIARDLREVISVVRGEADKRAPNPRALSSSLENYPLDLKDVQGQDVARRALEIASAGGHNLLMLGPPGSGKTMLARRFPSISPPMSFEEQLEVSMIASVSGYVRPDRALIQERPFRAPHHTLSQVALAGGGPRCRPGEVSLAHHGVLFLDELPEFKRAALEVLRQPLEDGEIIISRAAHTLTYPAQFSLIAAMNPCPCGYFGATKRVCQCSPQMRLAYLNRISGPLLDRIDLQVNVSAVDPHDLRRHQRGEDSQTVRARVCAARSKQQARLGENEGNCNAQMTPQALRKYCVLDDATEALLLRAIDTLGLSARAHDRVLKVARTIADLSDSERIEVHHLAEATQYRQLDRLWSEAA